MFWLLGTSVGLLAQLAPTDASRGLRDLNLPRLAPLGPGKPDPLLKDEPARSATSTAGKGVSVRVDKVDMVCADAQVAASLRPLAASREGRRCDFAELEAMIVEMREALAFQGFVGAGVWFPRQDVTGGVIKVQVDLPKLGSAMVQGKDESRGLWSEILGRSGVRSGAYLRSDDLEHGLLMIERYEGSPVRGLLRPGSAEGLVDLSLQPPGDSPNRYGIFADNHGSRFTGAARAVVSAETRRLSSLPDHLTVSGAFSEGMNYGSIQYVFFPTANGLRVGASAGLMNYRIIEGGLAGAGVEGSSDVYGFAASYPLILRQAESLSLEFKADDRTILEHAAGSLRGHKRIHSASLGAQYSARSATKATSASLFLSSGSLRQLENAAASQDAAGPGTVGGFSKLKADLVSQWATPVGVLLLGLEGQHAFQNLDPTEELAVGGPYGVRAYPVGEGSIDSGMLFRAELSRPFGSWSGWAIDGGIFADYGLLRPNREDYPGYVGPGSYHLGGWGVMINARSPEGYFIKSFITNRLGNNSGADGNGNDADGRSSDWRVWAQAGFTF